MTCGPSEVVVWSMGRRRRCCLPIAPEFFKKCFGWLVRRRAAASGCCFVCTAGLRCFAGCWRRCLTMSLPLPQLANTKHDSWRASTLRAFTSLPGCCSSVGSVAQEAFFLGRGRRRRPLPPTMVGGAPRSGRKNGITPLRMLRSMFSKQVTWRCRHQNWLCCSSILLFNNYSYISLLKIGAVRQ